MAPIARIDQALTVVDADVLGWVERHAAALRPYFAVARPGGATPAMCIEAARSAAVYFGLDGYEPRLLDCVCHVLHAYRVAGLIDRRGEAEQWREFGYRLAGRRRAAGDLEGAAELRAKADEDYRTDMALESNERGIA